MGREEEKERKKRGRKRKIEIGEGGRDTPGYQHVKQVMLDAKLPFHNGA